MNVMESKAVVAGVGALAGWGCGVERWRCGARVVWLERPMEVVGWVAGMAGLCVALGVVGLVRPVGEVGVGGMEKAKGEEAGEEWVMVEVGGEAAALGDAEEVAEAEVEAVAEEAEVLDAVEALTADDVFVIPVAPAVEEMEQEARKPPKPVAVRPTVRPTAGGKPASTPERSRTTGGAVGRPDGTATGAGTGSGTGGTAGRGRGAGYFPTPPYPAQARSRGQQGTVQLMVVFGADGQVASATVSRSSGYSELDRAAAQWVRRRWRAAAGQVGTFRLPVHFKLR
ncbi:MAG: energy transducer TonB [Verrucomicrobiales bacterium]